MNRNDLFAIIGNGLTYVFASIQANEVFQIIEFCLSILTSRVIITLKLVAWWKKSKKDGKIDEDEVNELIDIVSNGKKEIEDKKGEKDE